MGSVNSGTSAHSMIEAFYAAEPKDGLVSVELREGIAVPGHPAQVSVESLWSEVERKKGHGTRALQLLCAVADAHGIALALEPCPLRYDLDTNPERYTDAEADRLDDLNKLGLSKERVMAWYAKHGFVVTGGCLEHPEMVRTPRPPERLADSVQH